MSGKIVRLVTDNCLADNCSTRRGAAADESPADRVSSRRDPAPESARSEAIRLALRELGYIEGQNIAIEYRYAEGNPDRLPELAAELVRLNVDVIFATSRTIAIVAKKATQTIPIVFHGAAEPVASGLVDSLRGPAGISRDSPLSRRCWLASDWSC